MSKTILLTGATGFLGSNLLRRLLADGHQCLLLKRKSSNLKRIADLLPYTPVYNADDGETDRVFEQHRIDAIVHCATNYGRGDVQPTEIIEANLTLPLQLLQLARAHGVRAFLNSDTILDKRVNHYSLSKSQFVEWLKVFADPLVCVDVALEHFYGPMDDPSKFVTFVIRELLQKAPSIDLTPGRQQRDFIYVDDVVEAFAKVLEFSDKTEAGFYRFEVGTAKNLEIREFVELARQLAGSVETRLNFGAIPYRANEVMESRVDLTGLRALGWAARIPLEEGLRRTIEEERRLMETKS